MKTIVPTNSSEQEILKNIRSVLPKRTLQGVYICFEFPPITSPAASCISRRLAELPQLLNRNIEWTIITPIKSYSYLQTNNQCFEELFTSKLYRNIIRVGDYNVWNNTFSENWIKGMLKVLDDLADKYHIDLVCTRSQPLLTHKVALDFISNNNGLKESLWFAEFSDIITQDIEGKYIGANPCYDTTIADFEVEIYSKADMVILTNKNQAQMSLANIRKHVNGSYSTDYFEAKTAILQHPIFDCCWCDAKKDSYVDTIDNSMVNVAYFGVWMYEQRSTHALQKLAMYHNICIHFFMPQQYHSKYIGTSSQNNIRQNDVVDTLAMLNIANNMDYLYVEDSKYPDSINPYLPSKLADYLSTNALIIANVQKGSAMDNISCDRIIKIYSDEEVTDVFVGHLRKKVGKNV